MIANLACRANPTSVLPRQIETNRGWGWRMTFQRILHSGINTQCHKIIGQIKTCKCFISKEVVKCRTTLQSEASHSGPIQFKCRTCFRASASECSQKKCRSSTSRVFYPNISTICTHFYLRWYLDIHSRIDKLSINYQMLFLHGIAPTVTSRGTLEFRPVKSELREIYDSSYHVHGPNLETR